MAGDEEVEAATDEEVEAATRALIPALVDVFGCDEETAWLAIYGPAGMSAALAAADRVRSRPVGGTEPDTAKLQAAVDRAYSAMNRSQYVGGPSEREAWRTASNALSEVVTQHKGQTPGPSVDAGKAEEER